MPARVAELRQEADKAMAALRERVTAARELQQQAMGATGEASSGDGRVRVVVDATGVVTSLTFAPSVFDTTTPETLATTVVATIQAAATKARTKVTEAMAPIRADGEPARAGVAGIPELQGLRFGVPEVPMTATDPTAQQDVWLEPARPPADESGDSSADVFTERPW
jgi:DNA-binding protein YbaB